MYIGCFCCFCFEHLPTPYRGIFKSLIVLVYLWISHINKLRDLLLSFEAVILTYTLRTIIVSCILSRFSYNTVTSFYSQNVFPLKSTCLKIYNYVGFICLYRQGNSKLYFIISTRICLLNLGMLEVEYHYILCFA